MIRRFLRRIFREELEEFRQRVVTTTADMIHKNNKQLEKDFIELGLLERSADGGVQVHPCPAVDLMKDEEVQLVEKE